MDNNLLTTVIKGGPVMVPIVGLSVLALATALERGFFWLRLLQSEGKIAHDVLETSRHSLEDAAAIAERAQDLPIGRYLLAPLKLTNADPETFRLAMEAAAEKEFAEMHKGDKLLETVVAISPLLGLLGTVTGLIATFGSLNIGGGGASESATKAAGGIGEALITTAGGMIVAILALIFNRIFVTLQSQQVNYFTEIGNELELIYRQNWWIQDDGQRNYDDKNYEEISPPSLSRS